MGSKPKVVQQDPEGDARRAAEKATAEANTKKAMRRTGSSTGSAMSVLGGNTDNKQLSGFAKHWNSFMQDQRSKLGGG